MHEIQLTKVLRYQKGSASSLQEDAVAVEEPREIRVEGHCIAVVMRTPGHDRELAAGFLLSEAVIQAASDVFDITTCVSAGSAGKGNVVDVALRNPGTFDHRNLSRHVFTSSSCGICSKTSIDAVLGKCRPLVDEFTVAPNVLLSLPARLGSGQPGFKSSGGLHACGLFDTAGNLIAVREDVGRHNALDKLIGHTLIQKKTPLTAHVVMLSGRASFEMMQKAYAGGISVIAAIGAPSSLAVEFARESGQTLAGFVRADSMNIYAGGQRIPTAIQLG